MKKAFLAALPLLSILAVATPAAAQDAPGSAERSLNLRGELNFGYDELRTAYIRGVTQERDIGTDGFAFGAEIGADARLGSRILAGAYAGIIASQLDECRGDVFGTGDEFCFDAGNTYRGGLRAGLLTGDNGVLYVKAGMQSTKIRARYRTAPTATRFDQSDTAKGWHFGAGAELDLGRSTYVKGEYNYERYRNLYEGDLPAGDNIDPSRHLVLFGFGVRIGAGN